MKRKPKKSELQQWASDINQIIDPQSNEKPTIRPRSREELAQGLSLPQAEILQSEQDFNLFLAGQGSGKSHVAARLAEYFISNHPKTCGFIAANTDMQLTDSTLIRIFSVWSEDGIKEYNPQTGDGDYLIGITPPESWGIPTFKSYKNKLLFKNGAVVFIGSLENFKAHDGKEFAWAILDETKDTKEEAVKEVIMGRLRQRGLGYNPLYIFTSPAKVQWLNEWFELANFETEIISKIFSKTDFFSKKTDGKAVVICSSYHNEKNLPEGFIQRQLNNLSKPLANMLVYGSPFSQSGGEFYKDFDRERHIRKVAYNPDLPLHITFDFNVNPYVTLLVHQMVKAADGTKEVRQIDEILARSPRNTTTGACRELKGKYKGHKAGLFIYGDPAGQARDTRLEDGWNDYNIIMSELDEFRPQLRVAKTAPSIVGRGQFINKCFRDDDPVRIIIGENCPVTIADYMYVKEDSDGTKSKKKTKNTETGVYEEKVGHCSDANDYFYCEAFREELTTYERGGVPPTTPFLGKFIKNLFR